MSSPIASACRSYLACRVRRPSVAYRYPLLLVVPPAMLLPQGFSGLERHDLIDILFIVATREANCNLLSVPLE
jgi:hypothetical protein